MTLKTVDTEIENIEEDADKIIDDKKQKEMKSQVKELQIYVHALINRKQQATNITHPQDKS